MRFDFNDSLNSIYIYILTRRNKNGGSPPITTNKVFGLSSLSLSGSGAFENGSLAGKLPR